MPSFSARSRFVATPNRLTVALESARSAGRPLLDLTESNPTQAGLSPSFAQLAPLLTPDGLARYEPESFGLLSAREELVRVLHERGFVVPAGHIMLTASTSEAYGYLFKLLCDPGDSVLVPAPSYPLFDVLAQLEQVRLVPYELAYDGEWHLDESSLDGVDAAACKAIVVVHPNNPTGSFLKRGELARIKQLGLPILSDEVFVDFALIADDNRASSALEASDDTLVFCLGGLSKACALPQLKLAWTVIAGPSSLVDEARTRLEHIADSYLSPGAAVQRALPALLATRHETQARIRTRVLTNLTVLREALIDSAASVLRVEGGWYAIVRLPNVQSDEEWALCLLERDGVLTQPGYYYELSGAQLVLSLICEPDVMREGVARLVSRVLAESAL